MFFVKKFFVKRALAGALSVNRQLSMPNPEKSQSFQLLLDDAQKQDVESHQNLLKTHFKPSSIRIFVVTEKKQPAISADKSLTYFSPAAISWTGKIKDETLHQALMNASDICLDFRNRQSLVGDFLLATLVSHFKVNFGHQQAADLCLKMQETADLKTKYFQLKKYLNQLNGK